MIKEKKPKKEKKVKKAPSIYIKDRPFAHWFSQLNKTDVAITTTVILVGFAVYFYLLTKNVAYTVGLSLPPAFLTVYLMAMKKKQDIIKANSTECMRYVNNVVYYLDSNNISQSLQLCIESVEGEFKEDLEKVVKELNKTGDLNLDIFKKYNLPSLDQLHETLSIVYKEGTTDMERVFVPIKDFLLLELSKQDKLRTSRKSFMRSIMVIQLIVLALPLALLFMTPQVYDMFLQTPKIVFMLYFVFSIALVLSNVLYNKISSDISVRN